MRRTAIRSLLLLLLPVVLLWPWRAIGLTSDDIYCVRTAFPLDVPRLLRGDDWTHPPLAGTQAWRPFSVASFAITHALAGPSPAVYRLTNYGLHGLACALVATLAFSVTGSHAAAWVAGLLFAVHPVHHENVLWIAGRTHTLSAIFGLIALLAAVRQGRGHRPWLALVVAGASAAALLSYEPAVILPLVLVGVLVAIGTGPIGRRMRAAITIAAPSCFSILTILVLRWWLVAFPEGDVAAFVTPRVFTNIAGLLGRSLALPRGPEGPLIFAPAFLASAAAVAVLLALAARGGMWRAVIAGIAIMFVSFLPFAALPGYADRFSYLSSAGFVLAIAAGTGRPGASRTAHLAAAAACVLLLAVWTRTLFVTAEQWASAGQITTSIAGQLRSEPGLRGAARLRFYCIPDFHGAATVYLTYFERDASDASGIPADAIDRRRDGYRVSPAAALADLQPGEVALRWNGLAGRLEPIGVGDMGAGTGGVCPAVQEPVRP